MKKIVLTMTMTMMVAVLFGGDLEEGLKAYDNKDYKEAAILLQKASEQGNGEAQYKLGWLYLMGWGIKEDITKGKEFVSKSCDNGFAAGCTKLGLDYQFEKNFDKSSKFYAKACELGSASGCSSVGISYLNGLGVEKDYEKAGYFLKKSCDGGFGYGCFSLGSIYYFGQGVMKDKIKAYNYWMKAAKKGVSQAQNNLDILCKQSPWVCK